MPSQSIAYCVSRLHHVHSITYDTTNLHNVYDFIGSENLKWLHCVHNPLKYFPILNCSTQLLFHTNCCINFAIEIITHPQDKLVPVNSTVNLTCTSSLSSNVTFSWTHNGTSISGSSTTGDTSILTITSVRDSDAGSYVCTVTSVYSGSLSVISNSATLTVYGMYICVVSYILI